MRSLALGILLGLNAPPVLAQTFVVDHANGPGTNFTDLPTAAATVPDGSVLLVRPGGYAGFSIAQKGLTVLAESGIVDISGTIEVMSTAASQGFVLRGVSWSVPPAYAPCVHLDGCSGPVVLEGIVNTAWQITFPNNLPYPLNATNCSQLTVRESSLAGDVHLTGVVAAIERCTLRGNGDGYFGPSYTSPGLIANSSTLQVIGCTVRGGDGYGSGPFASLAASEGILILNGTLRVLASTLIGGIDGAGQRFALAGLSSNARIDTHSSLQGGLQPWGVTAQYLPMPRLSAYGAPVGSALQTTVATEVGDLVVLVVGLPGVPLTLPGFQDTFWINSAAHVFQAIGVQQQGVPIVGSIAVPNAQGLRGLHLVWHAACFGPATGQQSTNPGITMVR